MRAIARITGTLLVLHTVLACAGSSGPGPLHLYPGPTKTPEEVAIVRIVKTHSTRGHPTIDVRKITHLADSAAVVFRARAGMGGWAVPAHFGGLPDPGQRGSGNPKDLPSVFHLPPGSYQVTYLYVPAVDRFGWTHRRTVTESTILECRAGYTYVLEGKLHPNGGLWTLRQEEVMTGG